MFHNEMLFQSFPMSLGWVGSVARKLVASW